MSQLNPSMPSAPGSPTFVTTQWTRVLEARGDSPDAKAALSELCAAYYAPVFAFIQRNAPDEDAARDLRKSSSPVSTLLAQEHKAAGKSDQFEALKPWLTGDTENISQADAARQLNLNEGAVKVAIHRLRRRFRELIKNEIGQTVSDSAQVDEELHYLLETLS